MPILFRNFCRIKSKPAGSDIAQFGWWGLQAAMLFSCATLASAQNVKITEYPLPAALTRPYSITAGPDGALWFTASGGVSRLTTSGVITNTWPVDSAIAGIPYAIGAAAGGIIAGADGALWFELHYGEIQQNQSFGSIARITTAGVVTGYNNTQPVTSLTLGPDGAIWFAQASGCHGGSGCLFDGQPIGRLTSAGVFSHFALPGGMNESALLITSGPDSALWYTSTTGKIGRSTTAGVITEYAVSASGYELSSIAAGPDGALWFTQSSSNKIARITTAGVITEYPIPTVASGPLSIVAGPDRALWFLEKGGNKIGRVTTAGEITEYPVPTATSGLQSIAAGPDGALWFTEADLNQIGRLELSGEVLSIGTASPLPAGTIGASYTQSFSATGGTAPYTWSATGLPSGMAISSAGFLSGTPVSSGTFGVRISVRDGSAPAVTATQEFFIRIRSGSPLQILTPPQLPDGIAGAAYSYNLSAIGGTPPYTWSIVRELPMQGTLPTGLSLDLNAGLISGTPVGQGHSNFTIQVEDSASATATLSLALMVNPAGSNGSGGSTLVRSGVLSQVASGGGWKSSVYIYNSSPSLVDVSLKFWADDGTPLSLPLTFTQTGGSRSFNATNLNAGIAPYATVLIETSSESNVGLSGWAEVLSSSPIQGYGVFHYTSPAGIQSEGTVPLETTFQPSFLMPYDNLNGFQTAVAFTNLATGAPTSIAATIWDENGSQLAVQTINLAATGHASYLSTDLFPSTTANRGMIQFRCTSDRNVTGLGLRVDRLGGFTSIPKSPSPQ